MPAIKPREIQRRDLRWIFTYKDALSEIPDYGSLKENPNTQLCDGTCPVTDELGEDPSLWEKVFKPIKESCETNHSTEQQTQGRVLPIAEARIWVTNHIKKKELEMEFQELAARWQEETWHSSSIIDMAMNQNYQRIIGKGMAVVPLILRELEREPDHWFWALTSITGENPIKEEDAGDLEKMTAAWLELGKERGWI